MDEAAQAYDALARWHHLIFQDWNRSIEWQAGVLGALIERDLPGQPLRILDCACGTGTQTLGLAARGHALTGSDISPKAVARARREARRRKLDIVFRVADMRDLGNVPGQDFDAAIAADNALPHLSGPDVARAARQIAGKLRTAGLFLATIRDYDQVLEERPSITPPAFFDDGGKRRIYHQVWDWTSDREYVLHLYITRQAGSGWECRHFVSTYRALPRAELAAALGEAGFEGVRWLMPAESGFYQPVVLARRSTIRL